jgi:branched-chain amino acid transport system ATP-binding protein
MPEGLVVEGLSVRYGSALAVRGVSFTVPYRSIVGMAGRNGAGKTSTLRAISALVRREGSVLLDGQPLPRKPNRVAGMGVTHVPEGRQLFPGMSVLDNLRFACAAIGRDDELIERLLDANAAFAPLKPLFKRKAGYLSGGEQQLLAVARGLVVRPKVLLIDEASLGLSPKALERVIDAVRLARDEQGIGVLLVDQNVRELGKICDTVCVMREGKVSTYSSLDERQLYELYMQ